MKKSEIKFENDSFVLSMMEKHPSLKAMKEELSFWQKDPRNKLMGTWRCFALPTVELSISVEENYFLMTIFDSKNDDVTSTSHPLHRGETDRLYHIIRQGKIVEIMIAGDMDEEGEDNGPRMYMDDYIFYQDEGTCEFVQKTQAMADEDSVGMAAMGLTD